VCLELLVTSLIFPVLPCIPPHVLSCICLFIPLYSLAFPYILLCIPLYSLVFPCILLFSPMFSCISLCFLVFPCVLLSAVFSCVPDVDLEVKRHQWFPYNWSPNDMINHIINQSYDYGRRYPPCWFTWIINDLGQRLLPEGWKDLAPINDNTIETCSWKRIFA